MSLLTQAEARNLLAPTRNKYHVAPKEQRTYAGRVYASKAEMQFAQHLDVLKLGGAVKDWWPQVPLVLHTPKGLALGRYLADFKVLQADDSVAWYEVKGMDLALGKWKRKHAESEYGLDILVVRK